MKNGFPLTIFCMLLMMGIASCDRRSCADVQCPYNQSCNNGSCYCADGYEGADCNNQSYLKYLNNYNNYLVYESCYNGVSPNPSQYTSYITEGNDYRTVTLNNLFGNGIQALGYIRTNTNNQGNIIEIAYQNFGAFAFSGNGTYDEGSHRITIDFDYTMNGTSYQCTHTFYPQ